MSRKSKAVWKSKISQTAFWGGVISGLGALNGVVPVTWMPYIGIATGVATIVLRLTSAGEQVTIR